MSNQFLGEIRLVGFNFAPMGWAMAAGQLLPISQYTAVFSLIGTYYGGNGTSNFQLPNLQGNIPIGSGQGPGLSLYDIGESGGSASVTLINTEMPSHGHTPSGKVTRAEVSDPTNASLGQSVGNAYNNATPASLTAMSSSALTSFNGGNQPHNNMMPFLAMNWVIALQGVYPARS